MPIVISRTGELNPQFTPLTPEQREKAWAHIIKNWTDKNAASFRDMLEADGEKQPSRCL
jgi:hypothetical protein